MPQNPPDADPMLGRLLDGRYRIGARVARGGMATVYEAVDTRLDRVVAVKVMHAGFAQDEEFTRRFQREARAAARLSHQDVVSVYDRGEDDGTLYLVMEYVPGQTLRDLIRAEAPVSPLRALSILEPVLAALSAAHRAGLVHRDVKPENVLLADDGRIKVADFGLAKAVNSETQATTQGVLIGTVSYLSPELVVDGEADARADVYAVGVILYELLTGQKPHQAESPIQVAYKHVHEDIPRPSLRVGGLPDYVDALVARATSRDVALRPSDAGSLLHQVRRVRLALEQGVTHDPELAAELTPTGSVERFEDTDEQMPVAIVDPSDPDFARELVEEHPATGPGSDLDDAYSLGFARGYGYDPTADPDPYPDQYPDQYPDAYPDQYEPYQRAAEAHDQSFEQGVYDQESDRYAGTSSYERPAPVPAPQPAYSGAQPTSAPAGPRPSRPEGVRPLPPRQRRRPGGPVLLVGGLVLALLLGLLGWYWFVARYTTTPAVLNQTEAVAKARLEQAGLTFRQAEPKYSETVKKGLVISSDPAGGSRILEGGSVSVVVSLGPERHAVPMVRGMKLDAAQEAIAEAKLSFGQAIGRFNETVKKGVVIRSVPKAGTELRRDASVDVVVSKGPRPIKVPDLTGKDADEAEKTLTELGFKVERTESFSDKVDEGAVISQDPTDGTLFKGDTVKLEVSKGPRLVDVPDTARMGVAEARKRLKDAGFKVRTRESESYIGLGYVLRSDPPGGTKAPKGSIVTLYLV